MQLKIEGRNKLGQLKMVLLHADTISDNEVRNALQMVGFPLSNLPQGHDVLASTGTKDQLGVYITTTDLQFAKDQAYERGRREGIVEGTEAARKERAPRCRRKHVADADLDNARREGYNAGFAAALPQGHVAYSDAELQQITDNAFMRGKEMGAAAAEVPANFPIPSDVWYGKHYGEFVTIPGFAPDSIPGASEHGYELQRVYAHKSGAHPSVPASVVLETADPAQSHANMIDQGFIPAIVILMR